MKTLINISVAFLLMVGLKVNLTAGEVPFKIYQVTSDGSFHFTFLDADINNKEGIKPVTPRTFYLETMRQGLLPSYLTYVMFLELSPAEIQALINERQAMLLAAIEARKFHADKMGLPKIKSAGEIKCEPINGALPGENQRVANGIGTTEDELDLPWIVKVIVDPTDGYGMPDFNNLPSLNVNPGQQELEIPTVVSLINHNY